MADLKLRSGDGTEAIYSCVSRFMVPGVDTGTVEFHTTSGTLIQTVNGNYDCTQYKNVTIAIPDYDYAFTVEV